MIQMATTENPSSSVPNDVEHVIVATGSFSIPVPEGYDADDDKHNIDLEPGDELETEMGLRALESWPRTLAGLNEDGELVYGATDNDGTTVGNALDALQRWQSGDNLDVNEYVD